VAPLFETLDDLNAAEDTMETLFSLPWYRGQISGKQEIMIGYSDSSKDAGRLAAIWVRPHHTHPALTPFLLFASPFSDLHALFPIPVRVPLSDVHVCISFPAQGSFKPPRCSSTPSLRLGHQTFP
jgi:hypothetical protein